MNRGKMINNIGQNAGIVKGILNRNRALIFISFGDMNVDDFVLIPLNGENGCPAGRVCR